MKTSKSILHHHCFLFNFRYFSEGLQAIDHFGNYIDELTGKLTVIRQVQDDEKTELMEVRNSLKNSPGLEKLVRYNVSTLYTYNGKNLIQKTINTIVIIYYTLFVCYRRKNYPSK